MQMVRGKWMGGNTCRAVHACRRRSYGVGSDGSAQANGAAAPRRCRPGVNRTTRSEGTSPECDLSRCAERASAFTQMGDVSAAVKALTAQPLAPAIAATLRALRDPARRPPTAQVPIPPECLRSCPNAYSPGIKGSPCSSPSPCHTSCPTPPFITEHAAAGLPIKSAANGRRPSKVACPARREHVVRGSVSVDDAEAIPPRPTPCHGVQGDDRCAATLGGRLGLQPRQPVQLCTRAGTEAFVRVLRVVAFEVDPRETVLSVDVTGAFDQQSMLAALRSRESLHSLLPYVRQAR